MLDVDVDEAEVVVPEGALAPNRPGGNRQPPAVQAFCLEDAPDAVAVEMGQEVADDKGEGVECKVGALPQGADHRALFLRGLPGQTVRTGRVVKAVLRPALAPLADRLGAYSIASGQHACGLTRAGDLLTDGRGGADIGMNGKHQNLPLQGDECSGCSKRQAYSSIAQRTRSQ